VSDDRWGIQRPVLDEFGEDVVLDVERDVLPLELLRLAVPGEVVHVAV
jgi:hypothetical protein